MKTFRLLFNNPPIDRTSKMTDTNKQSDRNTRILLRNRNFPVRNNAQVWLTQPYHPIVNPNATMYDTKLQGNILRITNRFQYRDKNDQDFHKVIFFNSSVKVPTPKQKRYHFWIKKNISLIGTRLVAVRRTKLLVSISCSYPALVSVQIQAWGNSCRTLATGVTRGLGPPGNPALCGTVAAIAPVRPSLSCTGGPAGPGTRPKDWKFPLGKKFCGRIP